MSPRLAAPSLGLALALGTSVARSQAHPRDGLTIRADRAQAERDRVEAESRFAAPVKLGSWGIRFCDRPFRHIDFCVGSDRQVSLWHFQEGQKEQYAALLQSSPAIRAPTAFNTVRLEFVDSVGQVFVNGTFVGQAKFDGYEATPATMYLYPQETPLDVRFRRIRLWHVKEP